ncbi:MAG: hypothetical protein Q4E69_01525 [Bacilli bacterium]|nr:hypothetical protein [Bacilli bacterium]
MNEMVEFLTSKEIIVVYIVVGIAIFICLAIFIIDKSYDKRKRKQNTRKLNRLVEDVNLRLQEGIEDDNSTVPVQEEQLVELHVEEPVNTVEEADFIPPTPVVEQTPVIEAAPVVEEGTIEELIIDNMDDVQEESVEESMTAQIDRVHDKIEQIVYTNPEPDREEATRELIKLAEELEKAEKAQRDGIDIMAYETAQEENAIISLEELNKRSEEMYAANEVTQYADEGNEPISLQDLEMRKAQVMNAEEPSIQDTVVVEEPVLEEIHQEQMTFNNTTNTNNDAYKGIKKTVKTEIFSSVFGTGSRNGAQTEEELQKTSEFLLSLKDLQSRLNS